MTHFKRTRANKDRHLIIIICIIAGACFSQSTPVSITPTAISDSLPLFINTLGTPAINITPQDTPEPERETPSISATTPNGISTEPVKTDIASTVILPVTTVETQASNNTTDDKFQNFEIPIMSEIGQNAPALGFLIPVTGFPPGVTTSIDTPSNPNLISPLLIIPSLDVNIPIFGIERIGGTWDVGWLWNQAGWLEGTAYPTFDGNSVITAHVVTADGKDGPFAHLKTLTEKDYVFILNSGFRYIYKIDSVNFVKPDDMSVFTHEEDSWLTLVTCDAFDQLTGKYLLRVIVRAQLVDIQETR